MKRYFPLLFLLCLPVALKAQKDTVTQKINKLPYVHVDTDPKFPGLPFEKYLSDHIQLRTYLKAITYGNAVLAMKIESNGSVSDARLFKTISPDVDKEIIQIVNALPKWQPATTNNTPIGVYVVFNIAISAKGTTVASSPKKQANAVALNKSNVPVKPKIKYIPTKPEFPGGDDAFGKYLGANIQYPLSAKKNKTEGIVLIIFIINPDGSIGQTRIVSSPSADLSQEAIRVIKASPKWKPATENGKPTESTRTVPINFKLQNQP